MKTFFNWIRRFMLYVLYWRDHRATIKQLNSLTDRELKDIGMTRADIDRLVWQPEDKTMRGRGE